MSNWELNRELKEFEKDKKTIEFELNKHKEQYAEILKNQIGKDIDDVLNGKVKVKLKLKDKIKYKIKSFFERLFSTL